MENTVSLLESRRGSCCRVLIASRLHALRTRDSIELVMVDACMDGRNGSDHNRIALSCNLECHGSDWFGKVLCVHSNPRYAPKSGDADVSAAEKKRKGCFVLRRSQLT